MIINCIIIDDEPLARAGLKEYIADIDFFNLLGVFDNPLAATEILGSGEVHLLFLDIQMPKINGFEMLELAFLRWLVVVRHDLQLAVGTDAARKFGQLNGFFG